MGRKQLPAKSREPWEEIRVLQERIEAAKEPDLRDIDHLRRLLANTPGAMSFARSTMQSIRRELIERISHGTMRAHMLAEGDAIKAELGYDSASPLERLLIDHILTARLRLIYVENAYNVKMVNESNSFRAGAYWDNLLTTNHARFLRAVEALARVRRLARNTPALQINIAREGGKQINVQGGATTPREHDDRR